MLEIRRPSGQDFQIKRSKVQVILDSKTYPHSNPNFRGTSIILFSMVAGLTALSFFMFTMQQRDYKNVKELTQKISSVSGSKAMLENSLKKAVHTRRSYQSSLIAESKRTKELDSQISKLRNSTVFSDGRIAALDASLKDLQNENIEVKDELSRIYQERNFLQERLAASQVIEENLRNKIKRLLTKTKIELGAVVVTPSAINGKVLKASSKYNFVIVDVGKNDGIQSGAVLVAYRKDKEIGEITVEKAYDELSVGKASFQWLDNELDVGDTVKGKD